MVSGFLKVFLLQIFIVEKVIVLQFVYIYSLYFLVEQSLFLGFAFDRVVLIHNKEDVSILKCLFCHDNCPLKWAQHCLPC